MLGYLEARHHLSSVIKTAKLSLIKMVSSLILNNTLMNLHLFLYSFCDYILTKNIRRGKYNLYHYQ